MWIGETFIGLGEYFPPLTHFSIIDAEYTPPPPSSWGFSRLTSYTCVIQIVMNYKGAIASDLQNNRRYKHVKIFFGWGKIISGVWRDQCLKMLDGTDKIKYEGFLHDIVKVV